MLELHGKTQKAKQKSATRVGEGWLLKMFKKNRGKRYRELIKTGFMNFEAKWLSAIPFHRHPGIKLIMSKRRRLLERRVREADKKGWSLAKRRRIWNMRTRTMYIRRGWIAFGDHPTGDGPPAGQPNPFCIYRHYERSEIAPLPGDSTKPNVNRTGRERHWKLDRAHLLLFRAKQAWRAGDMDKYHSAVSSLDDIIKRSSTTKQTMLTAAKQKLTGRF